MDSLLNGIIHVCRNYPQIVIFLSLAIGYLIGKIKIKSFSVGATIGVLIAGLILGQMQIEIPEIIRMFGFILFIFCIGYQIGPHFLNVLRKKWFSYVCLTMIIVLVGLATVIFLGKLFDFDPGMTAGLLGGAMTHSPIIGTAEDAIRGLPISEIQRTILKSNIAVGYVVTYVFGIIGLILFLKILPHFSKKDLKSEAEKIEKETSNDMTEIENNSDLILRNQRLRTQTDDTPIVMGYSKQKTVITDIMMVGLGCALGTLLGLVTVPIMGVPVTLGIGTGVLISGLIFGWLHVYYPIFGQMPKAAQWLFTDLGLNLFIACVGLTAAPNLIYSLKNTGIDLFLSGILVTLLPVIIGFVFGKFILRINPVLLLGALTGAETCTAALNALNEEIDSSIPTLGYTIPYALSNVLLTLCGPIIVNIMYYVIS